MASLVSQNKVEEAEKKKRQSQEQLDGITQQLSELQSTCSELKAKVQQQNAMLKSSEVSVGMKAVNLIKFHEVLRNTLIIVLFNYFIFFYIRETQKYPVNSTINILESWHGTLMMLKCLMFNVIMCVG